MNRRQMFGKIMSLPDAHARTILAPRCARRPRRADALLADLAAGALSARDAKMKLAEEIVRLYHGAAAADAATEHFVKTVVRKEMPDDMPTHTLAPDGEPATVGRLLVLVGWATSNREAQRLVQQGGIKIDGKRVDDVRHAEPSWDGKVLQKGNHQFIRIVA